MEILVSNSGGSDIALGRCLIPRGRLVITANVGGSNDSKWRYCYTVLVAWYCAFDLCCHIHIRKNRYDPVQDISRL